MLIAQQTTFVYAHMTEVKVRVCLGVCESRRESGRNHCSLEGCTVTLNLGVMRLNGQRREKNKIFDDEKFLLAYILGFIIDE